MLEALLQAGMPIGEWNVPLSDPAGRIREVDLCYRDARLVVELDGLRFHRSRLAQQRDRASDRRLQLAGWRVLRFTWDEVVHRPAGVADEIGRALGVR
jgi:very-short-patch-repair endonuclease